MFRFVRERLSKRLIAQAFEGYLEPEVVEQLVRDPGMLDLGGRKHDSMTVMYSGLKHGPEFSMIPAEELSGRLNKYLAAIYAEIKASHGFFHSCEGDVVKSFFGAPIVRHDHALCACTTADHIAQGTQSVRSALNGLPMASTGHVGLATGPAVVGNIGSERAMRFDAVGHVTVVAKQLFDLNSHIGSRVLATSETADAAPQCVWRKLPVVRIDGSTSPLAASELLGVAGSIEPTQTSLLREFEQGRRLFDNRDYRGAIAVFDRIANRFPEDAPTLFFRDIAEGSLSGQ